MAFTLSQIENTLKGDDPQNSFFLKFSASPNYACLVDYLTGQSQSLNGLTAMFENYQLVALTPLLQNIDVREENDRLLLDVFFHPDVFPQLQYHLFVHLAYMLLQRDDERFLQNAINLFQRAGLNKQKAVESILGAMHYSPLAVEIIKSPVSPVKKFLLQNLPPKIATGYQSPWHISGGWNYYYFVLIEEAQPHFVQDYIKQGLLMNQVEITGKLLRHNNGALNSLIVEWIKKPASSQSEAQSKLFTAIQLYEWKGKEQSTLLLQASKQYVELFQTFNPKYRWESSLHLKEFKDTERPHLAYSAVAIHFILKQDASFAKDTVAHWFNSKIFVHFDVLRILHLHLKDKALPFLQLGLKADASVSGIDYYRSIIDLLAKAFAPAVYLSLLWPLASTKSKPLRELIAKIIIENDGDAEAKAIHLLENKNAETRQTGALILSAFSSETALNAVKALLDKEANDATRDIFLAIVKETLPAMAGKIFIAEIVASAKGRGKLSKPLETWLKEEELPPLFYADGTPLTVDETRFLLYRMSRVKVMRSDAEAKYLLQNLDKEKAAPFAKQFIKLYTDKGAKPEQKYLLALAALLGNEDVVDKMRSLINNWIETARGKMAEHGIGALALQGSNKALRWVEWYSRKYKTKKANVGAAALQALEDAAEEQGITIHELSDRVVPDFGFDGVYKQFDAAGETYRAFIDGSFKLCFFNEEAKKLKALPAAASAELKEEFKAIGKEVRDVVKSQAGRMEYYLLMQRRWPAEGWKRFFLANPVLFVYATKLLWGVYKGDRLVECFLCLEDTSLVNLVDDEVELSDDAFVGIVHPLQLSEEQRQAWARKFFDLSMEPIFPQLQRPVTVVTAAEAGRKIIRRFEGKETQSGAIKSTLERYGWRKGEGGDGGYIDSFSLRDDGHKLKAVLEVEGVFAGGFGYDHEPRLGRLYFIDAEKDKGRWFQTPKDENDERLLALQDLPPVFYSELMLNVAAVKLTKEEKV